MNLIEALHRVIKDRRVRAVILAGGVVGGAVGLVGGHAITQEVQQNPISLVVPIGGSNYASIYYGPDYNLDPQQAEGTMELNLSLIASCADGPLPGKQSRRVRMFDLSSARPSGQSWLQTPVDYIDCN